MDAIRTSLLGLSCSRVLSTMSFTCLLLLALLLQTSYPSPVLESSLSADVNINDNPFSSPTIFSRDDADLNLFSNEVSKARLEIFS